MACFHDRRFFSLGYNEKKCDSSTSSRVSSRTGVAQGDCEVDKERWSRVRASKQASSIQGEATGKTDKANVPPVLAGAGGPYPQANSLIEGAARVAEHSFRAAEQNGEDEDEEVVLRNRTARAAPAGTQVVFGWCFQDTGSHRRAKVTPARMNSTKQRLAPTEERGQRRLVLEGL